MKEYKQNDFEDPCKGCIFCYDDTCYNPTYNDWGAEGFQCEAKLIAQMARI